MEKADLKLQKYVIKFVRKYWDFIDKKRFDLKVSLRDFVRELKAERHNVAWVISEIHKYYEDQSDFDLKRVECEECSVWKLGRTYYKFNREEFVLDEVKPKFKKVVYFD